MVTSIARQSVIIKCTQQTSVLLGNYEFYYLAGLMKKIYNLDLDEDMQPQEMLDKIQANLGQLSPKDEKETYLVKLVSIFKVEEKFDDQMKELFRWGATEEKMWQVHI
ncbi:MAG: DUF3837 domain-containing protein [Agathobacter sp.]|nr:DUF3837 domain-containing protein [Agathobacter sp.]